MRVIFDDEALDDLQDIFSWIAKDNRRAAEKIVARIFDKAERLAIPGLVVLSVVHGAQDRENKGV
jgi:plasmid stabilization system protein ParE